jgi:hypothetical protein
MQAIETIITIHRKNSKLQPTSPMQAIEDDLK